MLKLDSEFEDHERALIYAPLGSLNKQERIRATWRTEGLAILAWSLGFFPFPRIDAQVDPYEVTDSVAFLDPEMVNTVTTAKLRPAAELDACRDFYYAIHCRFRQCMRKPGSHDIRHWFEKEWFQLLATESQFDESGDLLVNGTSISELDAQTLSKCESIVYQRHLASVWLVGEYGPVYSEVPVDT